MTLPARLPSKRRSGWGVVAWLLGALLAAPSPAGAASPPASAEITPLLRPIERAHAGYPEGATWEHDVLLEVTVDAGGRVEGACAGGGKLGRPLVTVG